MSPSRRTTVGWTPLEDRYPLVGDCLTDAVRELGFLTAREAVFLIVGLAFAQLLEDSSGPDGWMLAGGTLLVASVTLATRAAWMAVVPALAARLGRSETLPPRHFAVVAAGGMRGAVSVAAALAVPATVGGSPFPEREIVVALALGTVVVTLVLPALTLPLLIRGLGVKGDDDDRALEVRTRLVHAALGAIEEIATDEDASDEALDRARERYRWRR